MNNPNISLTDLVDVVQKSGSPKATKVTQIKNRPPYQPATDFYKPLRESIIDGHRQGMAKKPFQVLLGSAATPNKASNYAAAITGYMKWWGNKSFSWTEPPREVHSSNGVDVIVNPEIGLTWNNQLYFIKLYLKGEKLSKARADLILSLMDHVLAPITPSGTEFGILDVKNSKLFTNSSSAVPIGVINAELAYIAALWPTV